MSGKNDERIEVIILGPHTRVEGALVIPSASRFQEFLEHHAKFLAVYDAEFIDIESKEILHTAPLAYVNLASFLSVVPKKATRLIKAAQVAGDLTLEKIMSRDLVTIAEGDTLHRAFQVMKERGIHHLPVMRGNVMTGLISKSDIRMHLFNQHDESVRKFMQKRVVVATPNDSLQTAVRSMAENQVTCFPILDGKRLVGMVTMRDLIRILAERF